MECVYEMMATLEEKVKVKDYGVLHIDIIPVSTCRYDILLRYFHPVRSDDSVTIHTVLQLLSNFQSSQISSIFHTKTDRLAHR